MNYFCILITILYIILSTNKTYFNSIQYTKRNKLILTVSRNFDNDIQYLTWKNGINYQQKCLQIKERLQNNRKRKIIHRGYSGGLGHKYLSVINSFLYSILLEYELILDIPESYWNNTSNCLNDIRYNRVFYPKSKILISTVCSNFSSYEELMEFTKNNQYIELLDCRLPLNVVGSVNTSKFLRKHNLINLSESYEDFFRDLLRILLNPSQEISNHIKLFINEQFSNKIVLGIHFRTGGCLANFQEPKSMMTTEQIKSFPNYIMKIMKDNHLEPNSTIIFLSTDSDRIEEYLRNVFNNRVEIITSQIYLRSHSRGKAISTAVKGAISDLFLLAQSNILITCSGSGFSKIANYISSASSKYIYNTTKSIVDNWVAKTRRCSYIPEIYDNNY